MRKTTKKKIAPIVMTVLVLLYIVPLIVMVLGLMGLLGRDEGVAVMFPLLCWLIVGGAVVIGILKALRQRLREIDGGEEDEAAKY
ncbi:hypothetical protein [uncultured Dysosmobacter sp.]|uniref:hypothetical protein n=1 Tax=uncultured Dysosmobacter sp. TaxID=2591384 RepID=UPI0026396B85|nr:hypothetical protein [uncultured Dysosmobacter sp.]